MQPIGAGVVQLGESVFLAARQPRRQWSHVRVPWFLYLKDPPGVLVYSEFPESTGNPASDSDRISHAAKNRRLFGLLARSRCLGGGGAGLELPQVEEAGLADFDALGGPPVKDLAGGGVIRLSAEDVLAIERGVTA